MAWPSLASQRIGDWTVKQAGGASRRSNSANPRGPGARLSAVDMAAIEDIYRAAGRPAYVRIPSMLDPAVDAGLAKAGWSLEGESVTLVGTPEGAESSDAELTLSVSAEWLAASHAINDRQPSLAAAFDAVLHRLDTPAVFAAVRRDGAIKALCYGALYDGWLCVEAVGAHPAWRRQGLAGMAVSSVMTWGGSQGAHGVCLQTEAHNHAAQSLYRRLGVDRELYRYHYRRRG